MNTVPIGGASGMRWPTRTCGPKGTTSPATARKTISSPIAEDTTHCRPVAEARACIGARANSTSSSRRAAAAEPRAISAGPSVYDLSRGLRSRKPESARAVSIACAVALLMSRRRHISDSEKAVSGCAASRFSTATVRSTAGAGRAMVLVPLLSRRSLGDRGLRRPAP